jgi:hypothetical protein
MPAVAQRLSTVVGHDVMLPSAEGKPDGEGGAAAFCAVASDSKGSAAAIMVLVGDMVR